MASLSAVSGRSRAAASGRLSASPSRRKIDLSPPQLYTHVAIAKLIEVHAATHPAVKLKHKREQLSDADGRTAGIVRADAANFCPTC